MFAFSKKHNKFVICGNDETVFGSEKDYTGHGMFDYQNHAFDWSELADLIHEAEELGYRVKVDSDFKNWHGGKYAEQANMYGYADTLPEDLDKISDEIFERWQEFVGYINAEEAAIYKEEENVCN